MRGVASVYFSAQFEINNRIIADLKKNKTAGMYSCGQNFTYTSNQHESYYSPYILSLNNTFKLLFFNRFNMQ